MRAFTSAALVLSALRGAIACPVSTNPVIDAFVTSESAISMTKLLCNIGGGGCEAAGIPAGVVVASPSKTDPDYWYTWTRDSALVFKTVIEEFASKPYDASLQKKIQEYITAQAKLQGVSNPPAASSTAAASASPRRPQRDGPPLRAIAMSQYAKWLIDNGYPKTAQEVVWPVIRNDLYYTAQYWNNTGFDLWEEVSGASFFTTISQYRALVEGSNLAAQLKTTCKACDQVAPHILCFVQNYWNNAGYMVSNILTSASRSGKDGNSILASIHSYDPRLGCDALTFQPCSDRALANHKAVTDSFRSWTINKNIPQGTAVAVGRYIEDVYYNGNPWYLLTLAAAEQLYDAVAVWKNQGSVTVTATSLAFFKDLVPSITAGTYQNGTTTFTSVVDAVFAYADGYVNVVKTYVKADGSMPEQFSKTDGTPWPPATSPVRLARRRASAPSTCSTLALEGAYVSATAVSFPASQTPGGTETLTSTAPEPTSTVCLHRVTFRTLSKTVWGDSVKVIGSISELGSWNTANAKPLSADAYTDSNPLWQATISVPAGASFTYKFIKVNDAGAVTWESDPNRSYSASTQCSSTGTTGGNWQ
ncbi:unnamed protein product [Parascedosporium putredinis]|uniref:Glucoamylase n=1 Tax=Parascedosporium putredinis TaxID=1442378 RepID=A0A9P1H2K2_9PEZI|nr:unnamed protein product [Parascedosporium putredinis]CAI7994120.1 unnamed protein product [Parascedosporium putredinis]